MGNLLKCLSRGPFRFSRSVWVSGICFFFNSYLGNSDSGIKKTLLKACFRLHQHNDSLRQLVPTPKRHKGSFPSTSLNQKESSPGSGGLPASVLSPQDGTPGVCATHESCCFLLKIRRQHNSIASHAKPLQCLIALQLRRSSLHLICSLIARLINSCSFLWRDGKTS